ncbi:MAG TPA: SEC-C metal-binding domain-containing protein [Candidatus Dojkabacteria bacterium]|nr:SEC-C metal-binding domain-containing protein [Candidatus Dojkabacteria bacterium]HRP51232.1 SEC-C metal-binding domain-containing protein [Candidatus Dojkabacteria bacterium]
MIKGIFSRFLNPNQRAIKEVEPLVEEILAKEDEYKDKDISEMRKQVEVIRAELKELIDTIPPMARMPLANEEFKKYDTTEKKVRDLLQSNVVDFFAMLREINRRKLGKPHYPVQLKAATILAKGHSLTELRTGEGKTQVFHLPAALYGLTGRGSHVITVNDYLARRDGEYAGHAFSDLGISVGVITPQASYKFVPDDQLKATKGEDAKKERDSLDISKLSDMKGVNLMECSKKEAYEQDVLYATNNEVGFDYLRDNMVFDIEERVQKELYFCIVDEADSILIDEARTPLIISAPAEASNDLYEKFAKVVKNLKVDKHYNVDEKVRSVTLTDEGVEYVENLLGVKNLWEDYRLAHHLDNALKAEVLYKVDDDYLIKDGEILIVDEFTGRVLAGRRYSEGLHQAIEAKEGVEIKRESKTMATITFQNYFKLYKILSGGSGTILTEAEEFYKIYNLDSYEIPTNQPIIREDLTDKVYKDRKAKFNAVAEAITEIHKSGQPVLVGTASIEDSEYLSGILDKKNVEHEVLNAKFHEREASIVANAGLKDAVTVATNMAGRGTDIPLGEGVTDLGGLYIIGTQRHEARRVDNQLRGRGGRQGDPGITQFYTALDDEIMRIQGGEIVSKLMTATKLPDDMPIESKIIGRSIETAQKKMEGAHFDTRKRVVDYDNVINQQREIFYLRRLNLLSLSADALNKDDKEKSKEALDTIKLKIKDLLNQEVEFIINEHFLEQREDKIDKIKLINDFADLAVDRDLIKSYEKVSETKLSNKDLKSLEVEFEKVGIAKIKRILTDTIDDLLETKYKEFDEALPEIYKIVNLQIMDQLWTDHLDAMGDLREGIGLRGYAQRDPLVEYKNEAYQLFEKFINSINSQFARRILKIRAVAKPREEKKMETNSEEIDEISNETREMEASAPKVNVQNNRVLRELEQAARKNIQTNDTSREETKVNKHVIGRNDPCPCGSGLKYKKCGLINSPKHKV